LHFATLCSDVPRELQGCILAFIFGHSHDAIDNCCGTPRAGGVKGGGAAERQLGHP
jgi:hypothetical protein